MSERYIIDANILFGAIMSQKEFYIEFANKHTIYAPDFILKEIEKYEDIILKKGKIRKGAFQAYIKNLFENIIIIPNLAISGSSKDRAFELCKDIDEKDTPYIALSIDMDIPVLSNDKKLVSKLNEKGYEKIILMDKFYKEFYGIDKDTNENQSDKK